MQDTGPAVVSLGGILEPWFSVVTIMKTIEAFLDADVSDMCSVLSLIDLDKPVFKELTEAGFQALKKVFTQSKSILWVTQRGKPDTPYSEMMVGFGRTAVVEMPHVRLQFFDFEDSQILAASMIPETWLRFLFTETWANGGEHQKGIL